MHIMEHKKEISKISLQVYAMIELQQQKNGLQHNNFQQYRQYLTRRLSRLYALLGLKHGKRKYRGITLTAENCSTHEHLIILVDLAERAWAMAESRKQEIVAKPTLRLRARHHITGRMKKAVAWSAELCTIAKRNADDATNIECQAYHAELSGRCAMHLELYEEAKSYFEVAYKHFASVQAKYQVEKWSLISIRISKIDEFYRQCKIFLNETPETSNVDFRLGKPALQWGEHRILLSTHQVIELYKTIQELEEKQDNTIEGGNRSQQRMHVFKKRIDIFDKIIDGYNEVIDICGKNMQKVNATDDMRIEHNYFFFQRQRAKCSRIEAYIQFYEDLENSQSKKLKSSNSDADVMFLYENLSILARECSMIPGLGTEKSKEYLARSQWAKGSALYFKGLAWCDMGLHIKGINCVRVAQLLISESINNAHNQKATHSLEKIRAEYVRLLLINKSRKSTAEPANIHRKNCMTCSLESQCYALAPVLPTFEPIFPKRAFYDCAYSFVDVPEMIYDEKMNQITEGTVAARSGWLGGWFS